MKNLFNATCRCTIYLTLILQCCDASSDDQEYILAPLRENDLEVKSLLDVNLVSERTPYQKSVLSSLLVSSASVSKLDQLVESRQSSRSLVWLAAWKRLQIVANARLLETNSSEVSLPKEHVRFFLEAIKNSGVTVPHSWSTLLGSGRMYRNGLFYPFFSGNLPATKAEGFLIKKSADSIVFGENERELTVNASQFEKGYDVVGGIFVGDSLVVLTVSEQDAWTFGLTRLLTCQPIWAVRFCPFWVLPEGSNYLIELSASDEELFVFAALPDSMSINCFDLNSGELMDTFSTRSADLSSLRVVAGEAK